MSLFDLFKKTPKKETPKNQPKSDPLGSPEMQKKRYEAAVEFLGILQDNFLSSDGKGHPGTILSVAAWLAGTSLYRSLNYKDNPAPGVIMLSNEVNEAWPELMNLFLYYCQRNGIALKTDQLVLKTPPEHKPQMEILQAQEKFQDAYNEIMRKHGLDYLDGARAGMIACSILFQHLCTRAKAIDPIVAAGIVSMGIVTGAKTVPAPLKPAGSKSAPPSDRDTQNNPLAELLKSIAQNSTDGTGTRLVLGEGMTSMTEAMSKGGKYILVHPEIISRLKEKNIDPFLIYATAMSLEMESKISRIDFVGVNVEEILKTSSGKPADQAPIHIRQVLWIQANAGRLGYERSGNSWILKQP